MRREPALFFCLRRDFKMADSIHGDFLSYLLSGTVMFAFFYIVFLALRVESGGAQKTPKRVHNDVTRPQEARVVARTVRAERVEYVEKKMRGL
jgi:hypothetical protein